jgi:hypothetical protein
MTSCHRCLGLPTGLVPIGFQSSSFLVGLAWSILWKCPSHLILCALMNLTISAPSINLSISMLFRIIHILSILTGPNIFLNASVYQCKEIWTLARRCVSDETQRFPVCLNAQYVFIQNSLWCKLTLVLHFTGISVP